MDAFLLADFLGIGEGIDSMGTPSKALVFGGLGFALSTLPWAAIIKFVIGIFVKIPDTVPDPNNPPPVVDPDTNPIFAIIMQLLPLIVSLFPKGVSPAEKTQIVKAVGDACDCHCCEDDHAA